MCDCARERIQIGAHFVILTSHLSIYIVSVATVAAVIVVVATVTLVDIIKHIYMLAYIFAFFALFTLIDRKIWQKCETAKVVSCKIAKQKSIM